MKNRGVPARYTVFVTGYSGTALLKKLGLKPGATALFINAPAQYGELLGALPEYVTLRQRLGGSIDFIHLFASTSRELDARLAKARRSLARDGCLWVSWPKKTSSISSDLDGNGVRRAGLEAGLVDVKVCAVDDDWSGLKFVYRLKDR